MQPHTLILLVTDIDDHLTAYRESFLAHGFAVDTARRGHDALIQAHHRLPHCALIDVRLPDMTGWQLCTALKARRTTRKIPVVVLTPDVTSDRARESLEAGCQAWLARPSNAGEVVRTVRQVLSLDADAPSCADESLLGLSVVCGGCGSANVRAALRIAAIQYYCCKGCGLCWRTEAAALV